MIVTREVPFVSAPLTDAWRLSQLEASVMAGRIQNAQDIAAMRLELLRESAATRAAIAAQKDLDLRFELLRLQTDGRR
jgi:hypothetical protein